MEIHENIYAVLPDNDPGDGMSFIIAKMDRAATLKQSAVAQKGKPQQKQIKKKQQQQQQLPAADALPSRPPPSPPSQRESESKSIQQKPMRRSGRGRGGYRENGDSGDGGRQDATPSLDDAFEFPVLRSGIAAATAKTKKFVQQA